MFWPGLRVLCQIALRDVFSLSDIENALHRLASELVVLHEDKESKSCLFRARLFGSVKIYGHLMQNAWLD